MKYFRLGENKITINNFGNHFLILKELNDNNNILPKLGNIIFNSSFNFIDEVISTEVEICLKLNDKFSPESVYTLIKESDLSYQSAIDKKQNIFNNTYKLPVCFETGTDWELIETLCLTTKEQYINEITDIEFSLAMYGFLPGFLYLNGLPQHMHCKRKPSPSTRTQPNSLAIGAQYLGLYSIPSPAGWNIIGTSPFSVNNIPNIPPNLLNVGDRIRLERINYEKYRELNSRSQNIIGYNA